MNDDGDILDYGRRILLAEGEAIVISEIAVPLTGMLLKVQAAAAPGGEAR